MTLRGRRRQLGPAPGPRADRGAAVSEFALLAGLVTLLVLAAVQLGYALHVRNTATADVIEGARYGARADSTPADGAARARTLLSAGLPGGADVPVQARRASTGGIQVVEVSARVRLPVLGPFGPRAMTVSGQAYAEDQ